MSGNFCKSFHLQKIFFDTSMMLGALEHNFKSFHSYTCINILENIQE